MQRKFLRVVLVIAVAFAAGHIVQSMKTGKAAGTSDSAQSDSPDRILHVPAEAADSPPTIVSTGASSVATDAALFRQENSAPDAR